MTDVEWGTFSNDHGMGVNELSDFESVAGDCDNAREAETHVLEPVGDLCCNGSDVKNIDVSSTVANDLQHNCASDATIVCGTGTTHALVAGLRRARLQAA